ncbi:MAG TPA: hypothetical protein VG206_03945 [Terriglobia bacterium]|nr:hypothetical protein [Terriglobia bacterium]
MKKIARMLRAHRQLLLNYFKAKKQISIKTSREAFAAHFQDLTAARIAVEAGTHSAWVSHLLEESGHEVLVINAREIPTIQSQQQKNDNGDAEKLGRYAPV